MAWQFSADVPVYRQIVSVIRRDIISGRFAPDEQIPSVRVLAFEASVNPNTMQRALTELENEGLLVSKGTVGRFVTSRADVLGLAREKAKAEVLRDLVGKARDLGISYSEMIEFVKSAELNECEVKNNG